LLKINISTKFQLSLIVAPETGVNDLIKIKIRGMITKSNVKIIKGVINANLLLQLVENLNFLNPYFLAELLFGICFLLWFSNCICII
jgi:hypothetical protein